MRELPAEELERRLAEEVMSDIPQPLLAVLRTIQDDDELWDRVVHEIDAERPDLAADFLKSILEVADVVGDNSQEAWTHYDVVWVALHNAIGCEHRKDAAAKELAAMIPCTYYRFRIIRKSSRESGETYALTTDGWLCDALAKSPTSD
jgi:hypothetical protein